MRFARFYYLYSLVFVFVIPVFIEGFFIWPRIDKVSLYTFMIGITVVGSLWDMWATRHGKRDSVWLWQFNKKDTLGITFFDLPIEEYFFYLATSVYVIFTWECIQSVNEIPILYLILPLVAVWSLLFIGLPYVNGSRNKRGF